MSQYESMKAAWVAKHPDATPEEYTRAMRRIARRLGI